MYTIHLSGVSSCPDSSPPFHDLRKKPDVVLNNPVEQVSEVSASSCQLLAANFGACGLGQVSGTERPWHEGRFGWRQKEHQTPSGSTQPTWNVWSLGSLWLFFLESPTNMSSIPMLLIGWSSPTPSRNLDEFGAFRISNFKQCKTPGSECSACLHCLTLRRIKVFPSTLPRTCHLLTSVFPRWIQCVACGAQTEILPGASVPTSAKPKRALSRCCTSQIR